MRVCRLTWDFPREAELTHGLGPNFYYISKEQAKQGLDVQAISSARPSKPSYEEVDSVKVHRVHSPYNINAMRLLQRLHREKQIWVIHAHGTCGITYPLLRFRMKRPLVVHVHGTTLEHAGRFHARTESQKPKSPVRSSIQEAYTLLRQRYFWRRADLLIAVSHAVRKELIHHYNVQADKISVVYNGIDPQAFSKMADSEKLRHELGLDKKRVILYVGHFGPRKGLHVLLNAMPAILRDVPDAYLLCVGGTPKWLGTTAYWSALQKTIQTNSLEHAVRLMGEVPHNALSAYYSMADVFVFPSFYEGLGKVILEANACGAPVVTTRTGGIPEIVNEGVNGLLVEPGSPSQLAEKVVWILKNGPEARRMGEEGRKIVLTSFTWERTAQSLLEAYRKVA